MNRQYIGKLCSWIGSKMVSYVHEQTVKCKLRSWTGSTMASYVHEQAVKWQVTFMKRQYNGKLRSWTGSTMASYVHEKAVKWQVTFMNRQYNGKLCPWTDSKMQVTFMKRQYNGKLRSWTSSTMASYVHEQAVQSSSTSNLFTVRNGIWNIHAQNLSLGNYLRILGRKIYGTLLKNFTVC